MDHDFRSRVLAAFTSFLEERRATALLELATLDEAAANETKSSAGDKYETAREMFSQARDMQRRIREEAEAGLEWLGRQQGAPLRDHCGPGALVKTSDGWLLIGPIPIQVDVDCTSVQGASLQSPLGLALKGARSGDRTVFRGRDIEIVVIL